MLTFLESFKVRKSVKYARNEDLLTVKPGYTGNTVINDKFVNADLSMWRKSFFTMLPWAILSNPQKKEKKNETFRLRVTPLDDLSKVNDDSLIWLGHCTFLIKIGGKWILTDPCLTYPPYHKRLSELPISISSVIADYLLISHGHYDHLDEETIDEMSFRSAQVLVPLGMAHLLKDMRADLGVQEAGWYQQYRLHENFKITFLPAYHWYMRVSWDYNKMLWGSFLIEWNDKKLFFAGDSAYAPHFKEIFELFGSIDYCLMPIGAYAPPKIMQDAHMSPEEAVQAFRDLYGKAIIPMHYGTFDLADEPMGEPYRKIKRLEAEGKIGGRLITPDVGEVIAL